MIMNQMRASPWPLSKGEFGEGLHSESFRRGNLERDRILNPFEGGIRRVTAF